MSRSPTSCSRIGDADKCWLAAPFDEAEIVGSFPLTDGRRWEARGRYLVGLGDSGHWPRQPGWELGASSMRALASCWLARPIAVLRSAPVKSASTSFASVRFAAARLGVLLN